MPIYTIPQVGVFCDICGDILVENNVTQKHAVFKARGLGWSIGKYVRCPNCVRNKRYVTNKKED